MGHPQFATFPERLRYNAPQWGARVGKNPGDIVAALELEPHSVKEISDSLDLEKEKARLLYNWYRNTYSNFQKSHGNGSKGETELVASASQIPEFQEAVAAINRYKLLLEKREVAQKNLLEIESELSKMRPVVEGFEILKRKLKEMKEAYIEGDKK